MAMATGVEKPHAVCIPFPAQGHINPMLTLAKLLHRRGFHITFVNTDYNHRRLLKSRGPDALTALPSFRFHTIPDGLPPSEVIDATQDIPSLCHSTSTTCLPHFKSLIARLNDAETSDVPPVSCIVSDGAMTFTADAAAEIGVPEVLFWTTSACGFYGYTQFRKIIEMGYAPVKDGNLEKELEGIPGMEGIRLRDIPNFIRTADIDGDFMIKFIFSETDRARSVAAIILNTFDALEQDALHALSSFLPPIYTVGPLHLLQSDDRLLQLGSNLWKEDPQCLRWLDSQQPNSVVYVNFGSITVMTPDQLTEFAWGLANSNLTFLWIIRPDLVSGSNAVLPPEYLEATRERGLMASWCPQEKVLSHPSVGGFLTHCGWNSTLESIGNGVPMVCWPFFAEQQTNCWYLCTHWGIGMEIDNNVKRDEVEKLVRTLMVGEKGKEMKKKAMEWKHLAQESAQTSSSQNLQKLIDQVLLPSAKN